MVVKDIWLLFDGHFKLDMGMLVWMKPQYYGKVYRCALKSLLVVTDDHRLLVDTGAGPLPAELAEANGLEREGGLIPALKAKGLAPEDISIVINTHLHFDHCGWNKEFTNARFLVQAHEVAHANSPHRFQKGGYHKPHFDGLSFEEVRGDMEVTEGVRILATPGHTPGHQSVMVDHDGRSYVFCGDVGALRENIERRNVIGITTDPVQCLASIDRLRSLDAYYLFAHDNEQLSIEQALRLSS